MSTEEFPRKMGKAFACSVDENNVNISNLDFPSVYVVRYNHKLKGQGGGIYTGMCNTTILVNASYPGQAYDIAENFLKNKFDSDTLWFDIAGVRLVEFKDQVCMIP